MKLFVCTLNNSAVLVCVKLLMKNVKIMIDFLFIIMYLHCINNAMEVFL